MNLYVTQKVWLIFIYGFLCVLQNGTGKTTWERKAVQTATSFREQCQRQERTVRLSSKGNFSFVIYVSCLYFCTIASIVHDIVYLLYTLSSDLGVVQISWPSGYCEELRNFLSPPPGENGQLFIFLSPLTTVTVLLIRSSAVPSDIWGEVEDLG